MINGSKDLVWSFLIEVPEIQENEYENGIFQFIGVPRPVQSKLKKINDDIYRIGYFTDGLVLYETISEIKENEKVSFNIHLEQSKLRDTPTDQHILKSDNFRFKNIAYELEEVSPNKTLLKLKCDYTIHSKMNKYADFWTNLIISDFEKRLLQTLKIKIEGDDN